MSLSMSAGRAWRNPDMQHDAQIIFHDVSPAELDECLKLNEANLPHVSSLTAEELERLHREAFYFRAAEVDGQFGGFLLVFDRRADYGSLNFLWFKDRYTSFAYIDRIIIAPGARRKGVGAAFYRDLEEFAAKQGCAELTCEYNLRPENLESEAFHRRCGFSEVGRQETEGGKKLVSLQRKPIGT